MLIFGGWFTYKLYISAFDYFIFDGLIFLFIGIMGILVFIWNIGKDSQEFKESKTFSSYFPSLIGILFITTILGLHLYQDRKMNSRTLIRAFYDGGYNGFSIDLKENGTYIMANGSGLGEAFFYGSYSIKDSIVTLNQTNVDNIIETDKLVVRTITNIFQHDTVEGEDTTYTDYLYQIDRNGKMLDTDYKFRVTNDNRKN